MTFEEFQATGTDCADVGSAIDDECLMGDAGRVYLTNQFYILRDGEGWFCPTMGDDYTGPDLADAERHLYEFALVEGYIS